MQCHSCGGIMERIGKNTMRCPECGRSIQWRPGGRMIWEPDTTDEGRRKALREAIGS